MGIQRGRIMDRSEKIFYLQELISCVSGMICWTFAEDGSVLYCSHPDPETKRFFSRILLESNIWTSVKDNLSKKELPVIAGINAGLVWLAASEKRDNDILYHIAGPAMGSFASLKEMRKALLPWQERMEMQGQYLNEVMRKMQDLPAVSYTEMNKYAVMMHYALSGKTIGISEIRSVRVSAVPSHSEVQLSPPDRHRQWMAEESILRMIREGDLNYRETIEKTLSMRDLWVEYPGNELESSVFACSVLCVLCSRAATEGGLSADTAYHISNSYIRDLASCNSVNDAMSISMTMFGDFVARVHQIREESMYSPEIRNSMDYIMMHIEEPLSPPDLAERMGYTVYYFTRKFQKETGRQLNEYIRSCRVERSKMYLETSEMPIGEIAEKMQFSSRSHYTDAFRSVTGVTPAKWRREHRFR